MQLAWKRFDVDLVISSVVGTMIHKERDRIDGEGFLLISFPEMLRNFAGANRRRSRIVTSLAPRAEERRDLTCEKLRPQVVASAAYSKDNTITNIQRRGCGGEDVTCATNYNYLFGE